MSKSHKEKHEKTLKEIIEEKSGENILKCYQCGKCTAGCPLAYTMDINPHQVIRLLQTGDLHEALESKAIWYCSGCQTCYSRCPQEVALCKINDALCELAREKGIVHKEAKKVKTFHDAFLNSVRMTGLMNEVLSIADYKLRSKKFFADVFLAPIMFLKGKLKIFPRSVKNRKAIKKIFKKTEGEHHD